jgi:uncharacterized delta-60 repeat protein
LDVRVLVAIMMAGCGRLGFDAQVPGDDADAGPGSDAAPFVEALGELDPAFGSGGTTVISGGTLDLSAYSVLRRAGGYLAVGVHGNASVSSIALIGYTVDGQPDGAFAPGGLRDIGPTDSDFGYGAIRIDANRILVNGDGTDGGASNDDFTLGVIDDTGALDTTFGAGGFARADIADRLRDDTANRAAVVGSTIVACGIGGYNVTDSTFALLRLDFAGVPVQSWGTAGLVADELNAGAHDECLDVMALGANVIAVGRSDDSRLVVVAYNAATGARDPAFATGGVYTHTGSSTSALAVAALAGDIVAVGRDSGSGFIVRLAPDGTPRTGFGTGGELSLPNIDRLTDVLVQPNDKLVVAGIANGAGVVARLFPDGNLDASFGTGGMVTILGFANLDLQKLALDPDGKLVVVGTAGTGQRSAVLARIR